MFSLSVTTQRSLQTAANCRRMAAQAQTEEEKKQYIYMALAVIQPLCNKLTAFDHHLNDRNYRSFKAHLLITRRYLLNQSK